LRQSLDGKSSLRVAIHSDFALARFNADGSLDTAFDSDDKLSTNFGGFGISFDMTLDLRAGLIAVGGTHHGGITFPGDSR